MQKKESDISISYQLALDNFDFVKTVDNQVYFYSKKNKKALYPLRSKEFFDYLRMIFLQKTQRFVSSHVIKECVENLDAIQLIKITKQTKVYTRIAHLDNEIYIDLNNSKAPFVKINSQGWTLVDTTPIVFNRSKVMQPLPAPLKGGTIEQLNEILNMEYEDFYMLVAFILGTFMPPSSYPILYLQGSEGSGKSTLTKFIKKIIDPSKIDSLSISSKEDDMLMSANSQHLLAFDNISNLSREKSDWLCKLTTGSSLSKRKLFEDFEQFYISLTKPILINSIEYIGREDFLSRCLFIRLERRNLNTYKSLNSLNNLLTAYHPYILGAIFDLLSFALRNKKENEFNKYATRLVDFESWIYSIEPALNISKGTFQKILKKNLVTKNENALEANLFPRLIISIIKEKGNYLEVTPTDLYKLLIEQSIKDFGIQSRVNIPAPNKIKNLLERSEALLGSFGTNISYHRTSKERKIILTCDSNDGYDTFDK
ncbi:hypothetical protein V7068_10985 [Bacillus sp. JJ634]